MKRKSLFSVLALTFAFISLVFTFVTAAWYSDLRSWQWGLELPVGTKFGALGAFADVVWMLLPLFLLLGGALTFWKKIDASLVLPLLGAPGALYAVLQFALALAGRKTLPFPLLGTLLALLFLGVVTFFVASQKISARLAAFLWLWYAVLELVLVALSLLTGERVSAFYFSETLYIGQSGVRYSYFVLSVFLYHLAAPLSVACSLLALSPEKAEDRA